MKSVKLLELYENHGIGDIVIVDNDIATGLIEQGIARLCTNRDFLVKPEFGVSKAIDTRKISRIRKIIRTKKH